VEEICSECDFDQSKTPPREVAAALTSLAFAIGDSIRAISADEIRRRPAPGVWSPLEYLGHLRESVAFHRWLIERALAEGNPLIPMVDPDESVAQSKYNEADCAQLIAQFDRRIQRLADALNSLDDEAADRTLTLGGRQISVALVVRSAWHECHHHHRDIQRLGHLE
jgi:DinB superfamily